MRRRILLFIAMSMATYGVSAQEAPADSLNAVTQCFTSGEFHYKYKDRWPPTAAFRTVPLQTGPVQVSVADGYRLMIYRRSSAPLVNLKIERSVPGHFAADRAAITTQMAEIVGNVKPPSNLRLETSAQDGIDILAINNPSIEQSPGVVSFYTLLDAGSGTIATAYMLNQPKTGRDYANDAEYAIVRDRFIGELSACMARTLH